MSFLLAQKFNKILDKKRGYLISLPGIWRPGTSEFSYIFWYCSVSFDTVEQVTLKTTVFRNNFWYLCIHFEQCLWKSAEVDLFLTNQAQFVSRYIPGIKSLTVSAVTFLFNPPLPTHPCQKKKKNNQKQAKNTSAIYISRIIWGLIS